MPASASEGAGGVSVDALELFAQVLSQSGAEASVDDPAEGFYDRLCQAICRLARLRRAVIFRYDPDSRQVVVAGAHKLDVSSMEGRQVSVATAAIAARALETDQVVEVSGDVRAEFPEEYSHLVSEPTRLVCVPMSAAGREVGVMLADRLLDDPPLDEAERYLLWTLGKAAALASVARIVTYQVENGRQLRQRIDLAREVHEGVIQRLFGVSMVLDGEGDLPADVRARCAAETQSALGELRDAIQRPLGRNSRATRTTFSAELHRLRDANPELHIEISEGSVVELPDSIEPLAQSVLAEAIRNVRKHAAADSVAVRTSMDEGNFMLEIVNDGVSSDGRHQPGMGLRLAAFEALQSGGIVEFGQLEPGTWRVRLVVPCNA